jgi:hypothetical protein
VLAVSVAVRSLSFGAPSAERLLQACREVVFSGQTMVSAAVLALTGIGWRVGASRHRKILCSLVLALIVSPFRDGRLKTVEPLICSRQETNPSW